MSEIAALAKLSWRNPHTGELCEYVLGSGATVTIGRSSNNDVQIAEQHVSRQHALLNFRDGIFFVADLSSSNGTFVNDQRISEPFPLFAGDTIRLYVPELRFLAADEEDEIAAAQTGRLILPSQGNGSKASLIVTNGTQEGDHIALHSDKMEIGRATSDATWEIKLHDRAVSRPHARIERGPAGWLLTDLGSSNGSLVNDAALTAHVPQALRDGDRVTLGGTILLFRQDWQSPYASEDTPPSGTVPVLDDDYNPPTRMG